MFLHDFTYVEAPLATVRGRLLGLRNGRLSTLARSAAMSGEEIRVRLGPVPALRLLTKEVTVELGAAYQREDVTVVPMTWRATGVQNVFPILQADLEVASLGEERTQLTLLGRYDPPLGAVGRRADQLLLHRLALASVRNFLHELSDTLAVDGVETLGSADVDGALPPGPSLASERSG